MGKNALINRISNQISGMPAVGWRPGAEGSTDRLRCITFKQYMTLCLYDQQDGYYRSGPVRIGRKGDFYTSSGVGTVLAFCLANGLQDYAVRAVGGDIQLVEWGAGTGRLSMQIQEAWQAAKSDHAFPYQCRPVLVDDHPSHLEEAKLVLFSHPSYDSLSPLFLSSMQARQRGGYWRELPSVVLANELLDAFPVHRVSVEKGELVELGVAGNAEEGFYEVYMPLSDERVAASLQRDGISLREGQQTEVNAEAELWLAQLGQLMDSGRVIIIDYGHEADEYTAGHRMKGTLLCYSGHVANDEPYARIGEQDITAHVPFTSIRHAAEAAGWQISYYNTQKQFLIDHGAMGLLRNHAETDPFGPTAKMNRAVRQLLLSDGMSETFKVLILDKQSQ
ncbi:SAM-dependent methyltransferase [Paenibacillus glycanilyticus]|uniref:class I SAM-dependent methyltransferase n=1 Tax=Paenibacillus glycanilyticus TaxID=126569 RepID=UPI00203A8944|nr:SAM-dependent methyltransferase [Paenibacillus glycanilyticus]MCM3626464.1 SAM-dependent methyltransferase [Paenibacillus glycanilyticus]